MRWGAALLGFASACNRVLGLGSTQLSDAPPIVPDARPTCPTSGPPTFRPTLFRPIVEACRQYTLAVDAGRGVAQCGDPFAGAAFVIGEAATDVAPQPAPGFDLVQVGQVVVAPDGASAIVFGQRIGDTVVAHARYSRAGDGTWSFVRALPIFDSYFQLSTPSRGAAPHVIADDFGALVELVGDASDNWAAIQMYSLSDLGAQTTMRNVTFTADGLRLLFTDLVAVNGNLVPAMLYAQRASIDQRFGVAQPVPDLAAYAAQLEQGADGGYMTEDCGRFYFSALESIIYVEQ
jgi:hypothetical protein